MHEGLCAQLFRRPNNRVAARYEVIADRHIGCSLNNERVFMRLPCKEQNIGALFPDTFKRFRSAGNPLIDNNSLHHRIVRKRRYLRNAGFLLRHKVIRIGNMLNHTAGFCRTVHFYQFFGSAQIIFRLRNCSGYDTDVVGSSAAFGRCRLRRTGCRFRLFTTSHCNRTEKRRTQQDEHQPSAFFHHQHSFLYPHERRRNTAPFKVFHTFTR